MTKLLLDSSVFIDAFDPKSGNHAHALELLAALKAQKRLITMPAHGWFEVQCALHRRSVEGSFVGPVIGNEMQYDVELIHIDSSFIQKYSMANVPYTKAGDHIFLVVAKVNGWPLVTCDEGLLAASIRCGVSAYRPAEFMDKSQRGTPNSKGKP